MSFWYPLAVPTIGRDEIAAATSVLKSGHTTMGERTAKFEESFAARVGAAHGVMVNSGSSADLLIALASVASGRVRPGSTVLVPAVTWPTQVWAWTMAGLNVHFMDVSTSTLNSTPYHAKQAMDADTTALSLVHLMGNPCDMGGMTDLAERYGMEVTEDCCEALGTNIDGRPVGTFGDMAAWSFFFSHHMTTMEGGMVTTNSPETADLLRCLRSHGWARHLPNPPVGADPRYTFVTHGLNVRPTEIAAAIGLVQLDRLDELNLARSKNYALVSRALASNPYLYLPSVVPGGRPSWFGVPIMVSPRAPFTRDDLAAILEAAGVETRPILAGNLLRQPAFAGWAEQDLPGADAVADTGLYLGLHPFVNSDIERVVEILDAALRVAA